MEQVTFPYNPGSEPVAGGSLDGRGESPTKDRVVVSVIDRDEGDRRRAAVLETMDEAQRLIEALITAGCDQRDVHVFRTHEVEMQVMYRATVHLGRDSSAEEVWSEPQPVDVPAAATEPSEPQAIAPLDPAIPVTAGGWGIHIRADRLVWMCLWTVSVVVLAASLLTTFSRPAPREFTPGAPSSEGASPETEVLDSLSSPVMQQGSGVPECARAGQDNCRCSDFDTQPDAQGFYGRFPSADGHIVDPDGDGVFCEWLVGTTGP
jgi:hypothetical protein